MTDALAGLNRDAATIADPFDAVVGRERRRPSIAARSASGSRNSHVSPLCRIGIDAQMTADNGMTTAWQSYLGNLAMIKGGGVEKYWTETEVYRCARRHPAAARCQLAGDLGDRVRLRQPVTRITASDRGVDGRHQGWRDARGGSRRSSRCRRRPGIGSRSRRGCRSPGAADGIEREVPDGAEEPFLAERGTRAGFVERRARSTSRGTATDGQRTDGRGSRRVLRRTRGRRLSRRGSRQSAPSATSQRSRRSIAGLRASFIRGRFMDWPSDPVGEGLVFVPRAGRGHDARTAAPAVRGRPHPPRGRAHLLRVRRLHGRRAAIGRPRGEETDRLPDDGWPDVSEPTWP